MDATVRNHLHRRFSRRTHKDASTCVRKKKMPSYTRVVKKRPRNRKKKGNKVAFINGGSRENKTRACGNGNLYTILATQTQPRVCWKVYIVGRIRTRTFSYQTTKSHCVCTGRCSGPGSAQLTAEAGSVQASDTTRVCSSQNFHFTISVWAVWKKGTDKKMGKWEMSHIACGMWVNAKILLLTFTTLVLRMCDMPISIPSRCSVFGNIISSVLSSTQYIALRLTLIARSINRRFLATHIELQRVTFSVIDIF